MISEEKFVKYCISIKKTYETLSDLGDLLGKVVVDGGLTAWFNKCDDVMCDLLEIKDNNKAFFIEAFWDFLQKGDDRYFIADTAFDITSWNEFYKWWAPVKKEEEENGIRVE